MQQEQTVVAGVVAGDGEGVGQAVAAIGEINAPGIDDIGHLPGGEGRDPAIGAATVERAGHVDRQRPGSRAGIAERQRAVEDKLRVVRGADRFPVLQPGDAGHADIGKGERIDAESAADRFGGAQIAIVKIAQRGGVVVAAEVDRAVDDAAIVPGERVLADAHQHVAADRAAGDGDAVIAATGADVAADRAARNDDDVVVEAGHEIAVDDAARHVEIVLVEFHVDAADAAAGHDRVVAIVEEIDDAPT